MIAAALPAAPSGISHTVVLVVGALLGLLIGLALAFVRDLFDDRLHGTRQLERELGGATLAVLPPVHGPLSRGWGSAWSQDSELAMAAMPDSPFAEAVRSLRVTLAAMADRRHLRTILVVGADASVSSGYIVAELGMAFAQSGRRVLLVAADMRASPLPHIFGIPDRAGLSDLLIDGGNLQAVCRRPERAATTRLPVLPWPSGSPCWPAAPGASRLCRCWIPVPWSTCWKGNATHTTWCCSMLLPQLSPPIPSRSRHTSTLWSWWLVKGGPAIGASRRCAAGSTRLACRSSSAC